MKGNIQPQRGAALLAAMVTVALVATLASAALWLHWRQVEIEGAERARAQTQWLMTGALDWTRLILAEDARTSSVIDHLGEPWAIPVQESRLSTFLSQDHQWREGDPDVFLSGRITDAQARLNLTSIASGQQIDTPVLAAWVRLFQRLNLPLSELDALSQRWIQAYAAAHSTELSSQKNTAPAPLLPDRVEQLVWLGLSPATLEVLKPYIAILPKATPVNLNTASEVVLESIIPGLDIADARRLIQQRALHPWENLQDIKPLLTSTQALRLDNRLHDVKSSYFEIHGRLRIERVVRDNIALVERQSMQVHGHCFWQGWA